MSLILDHFFTFVSPGFPERADPVLEFLNCQVARQHPGQGTENVCALFSDTYMEFIWVDNEDDAQKNPLKLFDRSRWHQNNCSPFGIAFRNSFTGTIEKVFHYRPKYIPEGTSIEVAEETLDPKHPMVFALPFAKRSADREDCRQVNFLHRPGHINIAGLGVVCPSGSPIVSEGLRQLTAPRVAFVQGKSWHTDVLLKTDDPAYHGVQVCSTTMPLSLHIFCSGAFAGLPPTLTPMLLV